MKATTLVSAVAGALLISAIAFAGSDTKQTTKPAVTHKMFRVTDHKAKEERTPASNMKKEPKPVMKQAKHLSKKEDTAVKKVASRKTVARRGIHHVKHQPAKTDAQKQGQKKS